jgi:uncharacterized protein
MKLSLANPSGQNVISGYGPGYVTVGPLRHETNLVVMPETLLEPWAPGGFEALSEDDFRAVAQLQPEIVLLGTGARQRFPAPQLLRPLIDARIGVETMDTPAACRTYNVLLAEGRSVVAALLFEGADSGTA